jgi:hypothetical protein
MENLYQNDIGSIESYTTKNSSGHEFNFINSLYKKKEHPNVNQDDQLNKYRKYAVAKISAGALLGCSAYFLNTLGISIQFGVILFLFFPIGLFVGFLLAIPQLYSIQKISNSNNKKF